MALSVDLGIDDKINGLTKLTKQEVYRMAQVFCYEYGTDIKVATVVIYQWVDIFEVKYKNDDLFQLSKEFISEYEGNLINWNELKNDVLDVISYVYVLADNTTRDNIIENAEQLFDEKNLNNNLIVRIMKIDEQIFLKKSIDRLFPCVYSIVDETIKSQNIEVVNVKCFTNIKVMKLLIAAIIYRDKRKCRSM